jgi:hypothetical protein
VLMEVMLLPRRQKTNYSWAAQTPVVLRTTRLTQHWPAISINTRTQRLQRPHNPRTIPRCSRNLPRTNAKISACHTIPHRTGILPTARPTPRLRPPTTLLRHTTRLLTSVRPLLSDNRHTRAMATKNRATDPWASRRPRRHLRHRQRPATLLPFPKALLLQPFLDTSNHCRALGTAALSARRRRHLLMILRCTALRASRVTSQMEPALLSRPTRARPKHPILPLPISR